MEKLTEVVVDTAVQEKAVTLPTDTKLLNRARGGWCGRRRLTARQAAPVLYVSLR